LLDCPHEHLVSLLHTQHRQLVFPPQYEDSPTREDFFEPARYIWCGLFYGWVPSPFPLIFSSAFSVWLQAFTKLSLRCPPKAYITIEPYLYHDESWYQLKHGLRVWAICESLQEYHLNWPNNQGTVKSLLTL
jgi:hypothetical protein